VEEEKSKRHTLTLLELAGWLAHFLLPGNTFVAKEIQLVRICVSLLQQRR
jgi:hypothetical protein